MDDLTMALTLLADPTERRRLRHQHITLARELDDAIDELLARAQEATDPSARAALLEDIERFSRKWGLEGPVALARYAKPLEGVAARENLRGQNHPPMTVSRSWPFTMPAAPPSGAPRAVPERSPSGSGLESLGASPSARAAPPAVAGPPPPIVAYPELGAPHVVRVTEVFDVKLRTRAKPLHEGAAAVTLARSEPGPVSVVARLVIPPGSGLAATGSDRAPLEIPDDRDSAAVSFELRAERAGTWPVEVALEDRHGVTVTRLQREVPVRDEAAGVPVVAVSGGMPLAFSTVPSRGLVLRFERAEASTFVATLQGVFDGWAMPPRSQTVPLTESGFTQLTALCRNLLGLRGYDDGDAREVQLQDLGRSLADTFLTRDLRDELASRALAEGTSLHVESDDAWMPWEALWIATSDGGFFLGERFAVTRGLRRQSLRAEGRRAPARLAFAFDGDLAPTQAELAALTALAGPPPTIGRTFVEVQQWFRKGDPAGVIHFACHGTSSATSPLGASLKFTGGDLVPANVPAMERHDARGAAVGALVFVNACQSGTPSEGAVAPTATTWPQAFMAGGAAACVATSWNVNTATAAAFAAAVYGHLGRGVTLGEAVRRARTAVRRAGEPDRLAWAVYALPSFRLATRELGA